MNEEAIAIGTMSTANMTPSTIDTYFEVNEQTRVLVLEHQVGNDLEDIYLQGTWDGVQLARVCAHRDPEDVKLLRRDARSGVTIRALPAPMLRLA